ncbi:uncharacterized protein SCODWIG_00389 [Saccharomycodes ludwigii]|uniref:Proteasome chaperone 3 n=1 Tax=Saccharomycodes ludwigii TaxID=36035 RepID=A0A376B1R7_9ASCO|nr:hypothetical protein SCDLUD_004794 [Saccharomycodes ludwigii]KAH3899354.1 hypothetical protein SCDLUD_004794 [Saccharomycodes ludwigii]SSD58628.1 uncharacterized protein SCODWIG_00389 [Saccharomycodes ludwigii]
MFYTETQFNLIDNIGSNSDNPQIVHILSQHFSNRVLVQLRLNGELDTTYSVTCQDVTKVLLSEDNNSMENEYTNDHMSNYQIDTLFGDSNNMQLPIMAAQISELYIKNKLKVSGSESFIIMLSSKLLNREKITDNISLFDILLKILTNIKNMY